MQSKELIELKKKNAKNKTMLALIDELATTKGFIEVNPELTLKTVDEILNKRHSKFTLIDCKLINVDEGSMAMEYDYSVVFQDDDFNLYGVKLWRVPMVDGEIWDDFVANDEDDIVEVYKVTKHTIEVIDYKFEKLRLQI